MALSKTSQYVVGTVIALLLVGILLPIGLNSIENADLSSSERTYTYSSQTSPTSYNITLVSGQQLNISITYNSTIYRLNLTVYDPTSTLFDNDNTANATLSIEKNATTNGVHSVNITELVGSGISFDMVITITSFTDSDTLTTINTMFKTVIPIVAIIGIVMLFLAYKQMKD